MVPNDCISSCSSPITSYLLCLLHLTGITFKVALKNNSIISVKHRLMFTFTGSAF